MKTIACNFNNYSNARRGRETIKFIVMHYTANDGDTAENNGLYFRNNIVKASAHYFIDEREIVSSVPWSFSAWHCGTNSGYYCDARNSNSIGVELCSRKKANGTYYFMPETVERAAALVAELMKSYNVPLSHVVRHYDVTRKNCPAPWVANAGEWEAFKEKVVRYGKEAEKVSNTNMVKYYESLTEIPAGESREIVEKLYKRGTIKGNGEGLHLSEDMVRTLVFLNREKLFK